MKTITCLRFSWSGCLMILYLLYLKKPSTSLQLQSATHLPWMAASESSSDDSIRSKGLGSA
ncbi:hypothetical protein CROQUDRAFT_172745 [Cronartium quercuum f. sp. fusiforme G11]|uniref:Uncharacterized protein n=1 Tax=Cronartium quercuum f. sp. fusiforme G11 TaxID=708437 RepID=A0A9P6NH78_9BASI|nr:hypothetical protein CROQUDRAFT_172745 [Cronartium quercuum f. sp. fusiforme G11]